MSLLGDHEQEIPRAQSVTVGIPIRSRTKPKSRALSSKLSSDSLSAAQHSDVSLNEDSQAGTSDNEDDPVHRCASSPPLGDLMHLPVSPSNKRASDRKAKNRTGNNLKATLGAAKFGRKLKQAKISRSESFSPDGSRTGSKASCRVASETILENCKFAVPEDPTAEDEMPQTTEGDPKDAELQDIHESASMGSGVSEQWSASNSGNSEEQFEMRKEVVHHGQLNMAVDMEPGALAGRFDRSQSVALQRPRDILSFTAVEEVRAPSPKRPVPADIFGSPKRQVSPDIFGALTGELPSSIGHFEDSLDVQEDLNQVSKVLPKPQPVTTADLATGTAVASSPSRSPTSTRPKAPSQPQFPTWDVCWEEDPDYDLTCVQKQNPDKGALNRAVDYYRSLPQSMTTSYHCLINLGCCHLILNQPRLARPLFDQALTYYPERGASYLNLVMTYLRIHNRMGAFAAAERGLEYADDLKAEQHRQLLSAKKALKPTARKACGRDGHRRRDATALRGGLPGPATEKTPRRMRTSSDAQETISPAQIRKMRKDLLSLISNDVVEVQEKPQWGRCHAYSGEKTAEVKTRARWQSLKPQELVIVRHEYARAAERQAMEQGWQTESDGDVSEDASDADINSAMVEHQPMSGSSAKRVYACLKNLPFLHSLPYSKALALLRASEFLELPPRSIIFRQNDIAEHVYFVVSGTVVIEGIFPEISMMPVPVHTKYDGQVFGDSGVLVERQEVPRRKAAAVAQEHVCLLRIWPEAYRAAMGAAKADDGPSFVPGSPGNFPRTKDTQEPDLDEQGAQIPESLQLKVNGLLRSQLFASAAPEALQLLAANVQVIELRYGDVFLNPGQALEGCFIIAEGYLQLRFLAEETPELSPGAAQRQISQDVGDVKDGSSSAASAASAAGNDSTHQRVERVSSAHPVGSTSRPGSATASSRGQGPSRPGSARPGRTSTISGNSPLSSVSTFVLHSARATQPAGKAKPGTKARDEHYDLTRLLSPSLNRPLLPSVAGRASVTHASPRKPGTPRRGTLWQDTLRNQRMAPFAGVAPEKDLDFGHLHRGDSFGHACLSPEGCHYTSGVEARVESSEATIMVLTQPSLLYLPPEIARLCLEALKEEEDPVNPSPEKIQKVKELRESWMVRKRRVLHHQIMRDP
eukprot:TRINITY_DN5764_c0_g1_i1.p1 TRINITY_DN5764_c0_g1~~TRINITY_DN5764_c0_g1_i1.p1  ORF type:complete len:1151 (+),score=229.58 TRINITY_DN5764_c0_g1_i1:119-3571(+)